MEVAPRDLWY